MKNDLKFYAWRIVLTVIVIAMVINYACDSFRSKSTAEAIMRSLMNSILWLFIIYDLFHYRFRARTLSYYIEYMRGKDSLLVTVTKILLMVFGGGLFVAFLVFGIAYSSGDTISLLGILSFVAAFVVGVSAVILVASYIKCCAYKPDNEEKK